MLNYNTFKKIIFCTFLFGFIFLVSCSQEELSGTSVVDTVSKSTHQTELDQWILNTITIPYGSEVIYRWDKNGAEIGSYSYPPDVKKVKAVLTIVKQLCFELYQHKSLGGENFWKGKAPIKIYLYGGKNIDSNGVELITNSTSIGKTLFIYGINDFDPKDEKKVYVLMRSVHHQIAKLLGEVFGYDRDTFLKISQQDYFASSKYLDIYGIKSSYDLFKVTPYANTKGFLTMHSLLSASNDFAEIVSVFLTTNPSELTKAAERAKTPRYDPNPENQQENNLKARRAHANLIAKEIFIHAFFKKSLKFSLKRAQLISLQKINSYLNQ